VEEGKEGTAYPKQGVGGHQDREDVHDDPLTGLSEKFDGDEAAGEEEYQGNDGDSGSTLVVCRAEVRQQKESESDRGTEQASRPWTAKEEQNPTIEQHKCGEEQEVHNHNGDEVREAASPTRIDRITNREAFLGMYLLDIWANHQVNRQAIFRRSFGNTQEVCFIDHGHIFGGPEWNFQDNLGSALHLEMAVYTDLWQDEKIALWISRFQSVIPEALISATQSISIQPQWYQGDLAELTDRLTDRLANLAELFKKIDRGIGAHLNRKT
jgi:hypothetical protein